MGRLTEYILSAFGSSTSDRPPHAPTTAHPLLPTASLNPSLETPVNALRQSPDAATTIVEPWPVMKEGERDGELVDCVSCKAVGAGTMGLTSAWVLYYTLRNGRKIEERLKRIGVYGQGLSLSALLGLLAVCRVLDIGPFDHTRRDVTIAERVKEEWHELVTWTGFSDTRAKINSDSKKG